MKSVEQRVDQIEYMIKYADSYRGAVSKQPVKWHIDHALKVIIKTCSAVKKSDPDAYKWKFNYNRFYVFMLKSFPRGVARAPRSVRPEGEVTVRALEEQLLVVRSLLQELKGLPDRSNFTHPYFGIIDLPQVQKFLSIHTHHHLKIMRDIIG